MSTGKTVVQKIGKYLKYQRTKRELTLAEFAKLLDVDPSFLMRVEKGYYQSVSFDATEKISKGLNMSLEEFLSKCAITPAKFSIPTFDYYFKETYQFPQHVIDDIKQYVQFLEQKFADEITIMRKRHAEYWKKQKQTKAK